MWTNIIIWVLALFVALVVLNSYYTSIWLFNLNKQTLRIIRIARQELMEYSKTEKYAKEMKEAASKSYWDYCQYLLDYSKRLSFEEYSKKHNLGRDFRLEENSYIKAFEDNYTFGKFLLMFFFPVFNTRESLNKTRELLKIIRDNHVLCDFEPIYKKEMGLSTSWFTKNSGCSCNHFQKTQNTKVIGHEFTGSGGMSQICWCRNCLTRYRGATVPVINK
ncbi:MAG: hypothetical protein HYY40_03155 [Bacteroidetes bacterium]|nr:hypothetical protein [Bacteroidota bacterium]